MAGAAIWKGYIHFGDIDVPVKLHTAVKEERIQFHLLHRRDHVKTETADGLCIRKGAGAGGRTDQRV